MLVDAYRVYADPMTSYFRLEKTFTRFSTMMKYYSFDTKAEYNKLSYLKRLSSGKATEEMKIR